MGHARLIRRVEHQLGLTRSTSWRYENVDTVMGTDRRGTSSQPILEVESRTHAKIQGAVFKKRFSLSALLFRLLPYPKPSPPSPSSCLHGTGSQWFKASSDVWVPPCCPAESTRVVWVFWWCGCKRQSGGHHL